MAGDKKHPKGILGRAWAVATGVGGAIQAPFGLVKDLALAPFTKDEFGGIVDTLWHAPLKRGGQAIGNVFGADEGVGAALGAIPDPVRERGRHTIEGAGVGLLLGAGVGLGAGGIGAIPGALFGAAGGALYGGVTNRSAFKDTETVWREAIAEPLSTAFTIGSLAEAPGGGGKTLLSGDAWKEAYQTAQHRSLGQSFALMFLTKDITNDNEVAKAVGSDAFKVTSAVTDAAARLFLSPDVLVSKNAMAFGEGRRLLINGADDINRVGRSAGFTEFIDALEGKTSSEIRHQFFPHDAQGGPISDALAFDPDPLAKRTVARALMGDQAAKEALLADRPALGARVQRLTAERSVLHDYAGGLFENPERLAAVDAELKDLYPEVQRLAKLDALTEIAPLREIPNASKGALRAAVTRSTFYQESPFAAPLRATFEMVPNRWVNLHSPSGDVQLWRNLEASTLPLEVREEYRAAYNAAAGPMDRLLVMTRAEDAAVRKIAEDAGMAPADLEKALAEAAKGRRKAAQVLRSRAYDGKGRSAVRFVDDDNLTHEINLPAFITQEQNFHTIVDLAAVKKITTKIGAFTARHPGTEVPSELMGDFYRLWKPSVLLRAGWPIRVVGDEQMRIMAMIGTLAQLKHLRYAPGVKQIGNALPWGEEVTHIGDDAFRYLDYELQAAYGSKGDAANLYRAMNSSSEMWGELLGRNEDGILNKLRERTGSFGGSITPDRPEYGQSWANAVNKQFGQDIIGKRIMGGEATADTVRWLQTTPEGQAAAMRFHFRAGEDPTPWVETMTQIIEDYTGGSPVLKRAALAGEATPEMLAREIPDAAMRPLVHGEIIQQLTGEGVAKGFLKDTLARLFKALGQTPTDVLSRNPFFDHMYQAEVKRLVSIADEQGPIPLERLRAMEHGAREYALRESKELLYDLAEESRLSEMLGHLMPFYSAWQEVLTRWSGLAVENPVFIERMRQVWQAPERMGVTVDERGWDINTKGDKAQDPISGKWVEPKGDHSIVIRLPKGFRDAIPGMKYVGEMSFNKRSANLLLQGGPGFGPPAQVLANEIAKGRPDLQDSLKFILPYGVSSDWKQMLLPSTGKRLNTLLGGDDDRQYANAKKRIFLTMVTDYMTGERAKKPTWEEATKQADTYWKMRTFVSWTSPVAMQFSSPYQAYIEAFRAAQERTRNDEYALGRKRDGSAVSADEWFLDNYNEELFALTQSMSKSNDGIPPTMEGYTARKKYKDLIERHPNLGGLIIGNDGAGAYSQFVYQSQAANTLSPTSGVKQRSFPSYDETAAGPNVRLGWIKYSRYMDLIDAERVQRGLPSLNVKAAADLRALKAQITAKLEEKYPEWADERGKMDTQAFNRNLAGFREIAADPRLSKRDEIKGLGQYLHYRDLVIAELGSRKFKSLTATANQDLADLWGAITGTLIERNLAFGSVYYRWLDRDPMEVAKK